MSDTGNLELLLQHMSESYPTLYNITEPTVIGVPAWETRDVWGAVFRVHPGGQLVFELGQGAQIDGIVNVDCVIGSGEGPAPPSNRLVTNPVRIAAARDAKFEGFRIRNALGWGLTVSGHVIGANLGRIVVEDCGVGYQASLPHYGGVLPAVGIVGHTAGGPQERTEIAGPALPQDESIVQLGERFHVVTSPGHVYPLVSAFEGEILPVRHWTGGGVRVLGRNTAGLVIESLSATRCAIGLHDSALYGVRVRNMITEGSGIGWVLGLEEPDAAPNGSVIGDWHPEVLHRAGVVIPLASRAWIERSVVPLSRAGTIPNTPSPLFPDPRRVEHLVPLGSTWPWPLRSPEGA